jgi:hypothetical protein
MNAPNPQGALGFVLPGLYLAAALLVCAGVVYLARRWALSGRDDRVTPSDQLALYRSLYEKGDMTQEEFDKLRSHLGAQLRQSADAPPAPAPPAPAPQTQNNVNGPPPDSIRPA